ncbi:hypothetical protein GZH53_14380 [Flavihumibacter sp. R14]|nr:hypothetical protein [Flavihumibacter soli]
MKKITFTIALTFSVSLALCQTFSLYNSRTLYDSFENPSQKAFHTDSSRKFAFNFFIPTATISGRFSGPAENNFRPLIYKSAIDGRNLTLGQSEINTITAQSNNYVLMFKIFTNVDYDREIGFAWQVVDHGRALVTNETLAIFDSYRLFTEQDEYNNIFNNNGYNQSYNQYSFTYREDFDKRLSLGLKFSVLSGITYHKVDVEQSTLRIRKDLDEFDVLLKGTYRTNVLDSDLNSGIVNPTFTDPGLAISLGGSYKFRGGWFLLGNLKDIGFIKWDKDSYRYDLNSEIKIDNGSLATADERLEDGVNNMLKGTRSTSEFTTMINGKAEALLNKNFGNYKPNLILSKNLFYTGGHAALVNNYHVNNFVFTATTDYNFDNFMQLGLQAMIRTPNVEFFMGSDNLFKTYESSRLFLTNSSELSDGPSAASGYLGFSLKFGRMMEHQANANFIPGMNANHDRAGIFRKLFGRR